MADCKGVFPTKKVKLLLNIANLCLQISEETDAEDDDVIHVGREILV